MCIKMHFYLFVVVIYFYAIHKLIFFILLYLFAILHEAAHILVAILLKIKIKEILLLPVGVCAKYDYIENKNKELLIAAAGPLFSIITGFLSKNNIILSINLSIALLNLIPVYPMDGGRILRCSLGLLFGFKKSIIISNKVAQILLIILSLLGIVLLVYFKNFSLILLDIYIYFFIKEELKKERIENIVHSIIGT